VSAGARPRTVSALTVGHYVAQSLTALRVLKIGRQAAQPNERLELCSAEALGWVLVAEDGAVERSRQ
jgi:hypothetical protein